MHTSPPPANSERLLGLTRKQIKTINRDEKGDGDDERRQETGSELGSLQTSQDINPQFVQIFVVVAVVLLRHLPSASFLLVKVYWGGGRGHTSRCLGVNLHLSRRCCMDIRHLVSPQFARTIMFCWMQASIAADFIGCFMNWILSQVREFQRDKENMEKEL